MGFASGMAAISSLFLTVAKAGSRIVAGTALYGGSVSLLRNILPRFGIEATFVDPTDLDRCARRCQAPTSSTRDDRRTRR